MSSWKRRLEETVALSEELEARHGYSVAIAFRACIYFEEPAAPGRRAAVGSSLEQFLSEVGGDVGYFQIDGTSDRWDKPRTRALATIRRRLQGKAESMRWSFHAVREAPAEEPARMAFAASAYDRYLTFVIPLAELPERLSVVRKLFLDAVEALPATQAYAGPSITERYRYYVSSNGEDDDANVWAIRRLLKAYPGLGCDKPELVSQVLEDAEGPVVEIVNGEPTVVAESGRGLWLPSWWTWIGGDLLSRARTVRGGGVRVSRVGGGRLYQVGGLPCFEDDGYLQGLRAVTAATAAARAAVLDGALPYLSHRQYRAWVSRTW